MHQALHLKINLPKWVYEIMDSFCHKPAGMLTLLLLLKINGHYLTYLNITWGPGKKPKKSDSVKQQQEQQQQ